MNYYILLIEVDEQRWIYAGEQTARNPKEAVRMILIDSHIDVRFATGLRIFECSDITGTGDYSLDHEDLYDRGFEVGQYPEGWGDEDLQLY